MSFPLKRELVGDPVDMAGDEEAPGSYPTLFEPEAEGKSQGEQIAISDCLESLRLRDDHPLTELADKQMTARLGRLALNAKTSMTEQGVPTLYLTFGPLKWYESPDSQVAILSPLLLFPAELEREDVESPWELKLQEDEAVPNHSLAQLMNHSFALRLPDLPEDEEADGPDWRIRYYAGIQNAIRHQKRWEVLDKAALGIFSFQKIAMWDDLVKNQGQIAAHELCRAIAGDSSVRISAPAGLPKARELDEAIDPAQTYHILDSDSSQHEAIEAAKRGASLILDGPPGTGKSQTIANVIAESLARGKTVLFVSEKSAALEVVKRRLDRHGLGDFCLECHSHKASKKNVIDEMGRSLGLPPETYKDHAEDLRRLSETRASLNSYVRALHEVRQPLGLSAYRVHGQLAALKVSGGSRCPIPDVTRIDAEKLRRMTGLLSALPDCRTVIETHPAHPWQGSRTCRLSLNLGDDIEHHFGRLARGLAELRDAAPLLGRLGFTSPEPTIPEWLRAVEVAREAPDYPLVPAEWFRSNPRSIVSGYIQLDHVTRSYRSVRDAMPEFSDQEVVRLDPEAIRGLGAILRVGDANLLPHDKVTVLSFRDHLRVVVGSLQELTGQLAATHAALDRALGVLGLTPRPLLARGLGKVQELLVGGARDCEG
jgi:DNA polymerase III delta prime subunit